jgi:hypothetical protein
MKSRSFGLSSAIHIWIITAVFVLGVAAQVEEWNAVITPDEVLAENRLTGDVTFFEDRPDGSTRVTRTSHYAGTDKPWKQRVVTTINGSTTIGSTVWNQHGEAVSYTEEVVLGSISYSESKNDINWQGKQIQGTRWFYRQNGDGSITGEMIEQYLDPTTRKWKSVQETKPTTVHIFHHPARRADASKAERILTGAGYKVVLRPFDVVKENADGQWVVSRIIYYYPADNAQESRKVSKLLGSFTALTEFQESDPSLVSDKQERSLVLYLLDESVIKKPVAPAPTPKPASAGNNDDTKPDTGSYAPYDSPARDQIAAALERNYARAKVQVDRPEYDDQEATRLLKEMESIFAFAEEQMLKEVPRSPRWQRFKDVKDQAGRDIRALQERLNKSKPQPKATLDGKWRLLINDQQQPGEFTFEKSGPTTVLKKDSKLCMLVFGANLPTRSASIPAEAEVRLDFGRQLIQIRGEAASGRLEFWATPDLLSPEFQKTKYVLVREN